MKLTTEELVKKLTPVIGGSILKSPEMEGLLKLHNQMKDIDPKDLLGKKEPVKFAQSARFFQALVRNNTSELMKITEEEIPKYREAFGEKALTDLMTEGTSEYGGYIVPKEYYAEIFRIATMYGVARAECFVLPMVRREVDIPKNTASITTYFIGENEDITESRATLDQVTLSSKKQVALLPFSSELLMDATPPLINFLTSLTAEAFLGGEDDALWNGKATTIGNILGNDSVVSVPMTDNRQEFGELIPDDLLRLIDGVPSGAEEGGKFFMNKNSVTVLSMFKDNEGRYLVRQPSAGEPLNIWGYPIIKSPKLPGTSSSAVDTPFIVFGNLGRTVCFGDRMSMTVDLFREGTISGTSLMVRDLKALRFIERFDEKVVLPEAIAVLKTAP